MLVGDRQKIEPEPEPKPGWVRRSLCGVEVWRRLENQCQMHFESKHKTAKTNNLQSQSHSGGPPHVFFAKWVNKMRFQVFTLPIYSFIGHLNQILATSSWKGKLLVRTKVFGDHVNFGETKGEDYTILYIYWLVGSTHLPNWIDIAITRVKVSKFKPSTRHGTVVKQWLHSTVVQDNEVCTTAVSNTGNLRYCMVQSKVKACHSKVKRFVFYGNEECACRYTILQACTEHEAQL